MHLKNIYTYISNVPKIQNIFSIIFAQGIPTLLLLYLIFIISLQDDVAPKLALITIFLTAMMNDLGLSKTVHFVFNQEDSLKTLVIQYKDIFEIFLYSIVGGLFLFLCNILINQSNFSPSIFDFSILTLTTIIYVLTKAIFESNGFFKLNIIYTTLFTSSLPIAFLYFNSLNLHNLFYILLYARLFLSLFFLFFVFKNKLFFIGTRRQLGSLFSPSYAFSMILTSIAVMSERFIILMVNLASMGTIYFILEFSTRFINISALVSHAIFVWSNDNDDAIKLQKYTFLKWAILLSVLAYLAFMFSMTLIIPDLNLNLLFYSILISYIFYFIALKIHVELLFSKKIEYIYLANLPTLLMFGFFFFNQDLITLISFSIFLIIKSISNLIIQFIIHRNLI